MEFNLEPLKERDADEIAEIEKLCFSDPWSAASVKEEACNENAFFLVCRAGDRVSGYAGFFFVLDEGYIANIAVHPSFRKAGVGAALMGGLIDKAKKMELSFLTLEVRRGNAPAIRLYERFGFRLCGVRRGFYEKPKEDALLMKLDFGV